ncbi:hypothetical protein [Pedobacter mucosus]|uniref:hypothetical protein n=1 Tax=Pedobacter mucosus TaxID=2895286 RepID=UPI001EE3C0A1|nr:hypothetical protein [Pedobacter mucosus]UKT63266.1 hypothetical protein LOK61_16030 [Pedobacter mucosus]
MRLKYILFIALLTVIINNAEAQLIRGCRRVGMIYISPPNGLSGWTGAIPETCPPNASTSTQYARFVQNVPGAASCPIGLLSLGGSGTLVDLQVLNCPLDSLAMIFILPISVVVYFRLRNSQLSSFSRIKNDELIE